MLTYITVLKHFMHVDSLRVENHLLPPGLGRRLAQQAAGQAPGFHNDSVLGKR